MFIYLFEDVQMQVVAEIGIFKMFKCKLLLSEGHQIINVLFLFLLSQVFNEVFDFWLQNDGCLK